ncbi:MAG: type VI secretion system baseplate subunit TssG [bacterium]
MNQENHHIEAILRPVLKTPEEFDFFEAVRRIQRYSRLARKAEKTDSSIQGNQNRNLTGVPLGENSAKSLPNVRFRAHVSNSFPAASIQNAHSVFRKDRQGNAVRQIELVVNFLGLFGPNGILPRHYTDQLIQLERSAGMPEPLAMRDFLDIFNSRVLTQFYLAWEKYQLPVHQEIELMRGHDQVLQIIRSMGGLGTTGLTRRFLISGIGGKTTQTRQVSDLFLSLRLARSRPQMSVGAVQNLLSRVTGDRAKIRCFEGSWVPLERAAMSRLADYGTNQGAILGVNTTLGGRVWSMQSEFMAEIGPVSWSRLNEYLPEASEKQRVSGRKTLLGLVGGILRLRTDPTLSPRMRILTDITTIPPLQLKRSESGSDQPSKLGWNTWLGDPSRNVKFDDNAACKYRKDTEFSLP